MRIAVVGTGVAGLTCVELLRRRHDVVVFEADGRPGGHSNTVRLSLPDADVEADTGFLVYTERAYPLLTRLFDRLGVPTQPADMSFSVSDEVTGTQWRGTSPATVFAQPRNALRPAFWRMLVDIARFGRAGQRLLDEDADDQTSLRRFLADGRFSPAFVDGYLVPIASAIWSADPQTVTDMPARTFAAFFERHGLLGLHDQASWRTVTGGARRYVDAILDPVRRQGKVHLATPVVSIDRGPEGVDVVTPAGAQRFDHVVVATHSDQALALLSDPDPLEAKVLGAMRYQPNRAVLHTDERLLPSRARARASWNYHRLADRPTRATVTYDVRRLQSLPTTTPVLVTLNREEVVDPSTVLAAFDYAHPLVDGPAVDARARQGEINGRRRTWFCGAYWGDGFHEDGVRSAVSVCRAFGGAVL